MTQCYRIFDQVVASELPLADLPACSGEATLHFRLSDTVLAAEADLEWLIQAEEPGEEAVPCARLGDGYLLRFPETADFRLSAEGSEITCHGAQDVSPETLCHLLLDQVIPRALAHTGRLVLHGSANRLEDGSAVVFLGESGAGKSTTAMSFHQAGLPLLCDDCLLLEMDTDRIEVLPSYPGARLWPDALELLFNAPVMGEPVGDCTDKRRLAVANNSKHGITRLKVAALFVLQPHAPKAGENDVEIRLISGAQLLVRLLKNAFNLDLSDRSGISHRFLELGELASSRLPVFEVHYAQQPGVIPSLHRAVLDRLAEPTPG